MNMKHKNSYKRSVWIGVWTAIGVLVASTNQPVWYAVWLAVGVVIVATFSWHKPKKKYK